jgi:hypothetical protein
VSLYQPPLLEALAQPPLPAEPRNGVEAVLEVLPHLDQLRKRGYSIKDLATLLSSSERPLKASSLNVFLIEARKAYLIHLYNQGLTVQKDIQAHLDRVGITYQPKRLQMTLLRLRRFPRARRPPPYRIPVFPDWTDPPTVGPHPLVSVAEPLGAPPIKQVMLETPTPPAMATPAGEVPEKKHPMPAATPSSPSPVTSPPLAHVGSPPSASLMDADGFPSRHLFESRLT